MRFIKWGKIYVKFGAFYDQLWALTSKDHKNFQLFLTSTRKNEEQKKIVPTIFDYVFTFWNIGQYYIFVSFEIGTKNRKSFIT